jgi:hypothetical protein
MSWDTDIILQVSWRVSVSVRTNDDKDLGVTTSNVRESDLRVVSLLLVLSINVCKQVRPDIGAQQTEWKKER